MVEHTEKPVVLNRLGFREQRDTKSIRVAIAAEYQIVRNAFAALLSKETDIQIVGELGDPADLYQAADVVVPDVLLLDALLPTEKSIRFTWAIRQRCPDLPVLVLSAYDNSEFIMGLIRAGAIDYVLKDDSSEMLVEAVHAVARGQEWLSPRAAQILVKSLRSYENRPSARLTERQIEVLNLLAKGYTNEEIAATLFITYQTVKNHVSKIFHKIGVETRVDAALYAIQHELGSERSGLGQDSPNR